MPGKRIPQDIKDQILKRVQEGKQSVVEIARQHGVKQDTVYNWVSRGVDGINSNVWEIGRLKRENEKLKQIIGNFVLHAERGKKD